MSDKKKKEKYLKQQKLKRNVKSILSISIIIFLVVAAAFATSFYFYTKSHLGEVVYPRSPLTKMMAASYSYKTDASLPIIIQCPTIPVMMNVSGTERYTADDGCVFAAGQGLYISIYETIEGAYNILSSRFASDLYGGELAGDLIYESVESDVGYFNGYPSEYQAGSISIYGSTGRVSREIYVLSIMMDMGFNKKLMLSVSSTDKDSLYDAGILLQSIGYTVMDISRSAASIVSQEDFSYYSNHQEENSSNEKEIEEKSVLAEESLVSLESPTPVNSIKWKDYTVEVLQSYPEAFVVLEYDNRLKTPSDAVLYSPDGTEAYVPAYWNEGLDGSIRFAVNSPVPGTWTIKLNDDIQLGTFSTYCIEKSSLGADTEPDEETSSENGTEQAEESQTEP